MKQKRYNETGRNMLEMLGVLAIIGVLSIVGTFGFKIAMTKHQTNLLINDVRLAGFVVVDEALDALSNDGTEVILTNKFQQETSYTFKALSESTETFEILSKPIPYTVCEEVKKRKVEWLEEIKANGTVNNCKKDDTNEISFFFNKNFNGNTEISTKDCRSNKDCPSNIPFCNNGICQECHSDTDCKLVDGLPYCRGGKCVDCPEAKKTYNKCVACPAINSYDMGITEDSCRNGCGSNYIFSSSGNYCLGCESSYSVTTTLDECRRCPNRYFDVSTKQCALCPSDKRITEDGLACVYASCSSDEDCAKTNGLPYCRGGKCVDCPEAKKTYNKCVTCPAINSYDMGITESSCLDGCGRNYIFSSSGNYCVGCESSYSVVTTLDECRRCPNRYFDEETKKCLLCSSDKRTTEDGLACVYVSCSTDDDCSKTNGLPYCRGGKCVDCPEAKKTYNKCVACPATSSYDMGITEISCHGGCGINYFFSSSGNYCLGCETSYSIVTTLEECSRCSNRYLNTTDNKCYRCPTGLTAAADGLSCVSK